MFAAGPRRMVAAVQVNFFGSDRRRAYMISYHRGRGPRPKGGWPVPLCVSLSTNDLVGKADLRNPEHVAKVLAKVEKLARGEKLPGAKDPFATVRSSGRRPGGRTNPPARAGMVWIRPGRTR